MDSGLRRCIFYADIYAGILEKGHVKLK